MLVAGLVAAGLLSACARPLGSVSVATVKGHVSGNGCAGQRCLPLSPANGYPISFQPKAGGPSRTVYTDDDGAYLVQLPPGDYKVTLTRRVLRGDQELHLTPGITLTEDYEIVLIAG